MVLKSIENFDDIICTFAHGAFNMRELVSLVRTFIVLEHLLLDLYQDFENRTLVFITVLIFFNFHITCTVKMVSWQQTRHVKPFLRHFFSWIRSNVSVQDMFKRHVSTLYVLCKDTLIL